MVTAKVVTPGLIDAHTVVGLNGYLNQPHDQMAIEVSSSMQPELRAIDAYNAEEKLIEWLLIRHYDHSHGPSAVSADLGPDDDSQDVGQECGRSDRCAHGDDRRHAWCCG